MSSHPSILFTVAVLALSTTAACNRRSGGAPGGAAAAGPPPAAVQTITLAEKPIEQASEFIATLRSQRSTTVQPEVDGFVRRILVKAGDRVRAGQPLVQIDAAKQQASINTTEANRAGLEADAQYWRQQVKRLESLVEAGAISRAEFDQARTSLRNAEARLQALDAQVREGRVELQYYRVVAPQAGIIGEIPIRSGDRVTPATVITTIDSNEGLEVYINVPLDRSPDAKVGLPVQLLDSEGTVIATNTVTFVAPRVDDATQTVLVKSVLRDVPPSMRVQQFLRARIVWSNLPGLTIPVTAVTRISGQYFCFVVAPGERGGSVARQRPVQVGEMIGNDYVVAGGLEPGDRVITSGIQKLGDGAPVKAE